jgi:predicted MFS family arabinose efflux permease
MPTSGIFAWITWIVASIFYAYQYVLRVMPNIMLDDIMQRFQIDSHVFGQFSGVYYIGYCLMHLPLGILLDRYGPKRVMPLCILMTAVGALPIVITDFWMYPLFGRILTGMGSSAAILGAFKIIRITFPEDKFTRMLSLTVTIGLLGAIYGGGPVAYLCRVFGYETVVMILVSAGIVLSVITYFIVPETDATPTHSFLSDMMDVLKNGKVLAVCLLSGLMIGPLEGFADVWASAFLKQVYQLETTTASSLPSLIFLGMCFGAPLLSLIAEKSRSYLGTIIASAVIMALSFLGIVVYQIDAITLSILFVIIGVCCAYQIIAIYKASTYVSEQAVSLTTALANMIIMLFGYVFHSSIGWTVSSFGGAQSSQALTYGIVIIPLCLVISALGLIVLAFQEASGRRS